MKIQKFVLTLCASLLLFASVMNASSDPKMEWKKQIVTYLNLLDFDQNKNIENLIIDFMVNENNEIIVLSTNVSEMDGAIKSRLNYKKINAQSFEAFTKYTLPVKINRS